MDRRLRASGPSNLGHRLGVVHLLKAKKRRTRWASSVMLMSLQYRLAFVLYTVGTKVVNGGFILCSLSRRPMAIASRAHPVCWRS